MPSYGFFRFLIALLSAAILLSGTARAASQGTRVALVVGNAKYAVRPLANPVRDAGAIADTLRAIGFDRVTLKTDLALDAFRAALREFSREARDADVALVYFAGHGLEQGGRNYLVPVDAALEQASDLALETMDLDTVREQIAPARRLRLVILDACRNAPFKMAGSKRSTERGLARVEERTQELIAFAAKEGTTADDGAGGSNSPFTAALLKHLPTPGLDIQFVFRRVAGDVIAATGGRQEPSTYGRLFGDEVALVEPAASAGSAAPGMSAQPPAAVSEAAQAWTAVESSDDVAMLEAFRKQFGAANPFYDQLAASRIDALRQVRVAADAGAAADRRKANEATAAAKLAGDERERQRNEAAAKKAAEDRKRLAELQSPVRRTNQGDRARGKLTLSKLRNDHRYALVSLEEEGDDWIVAKGRAALDLGYNMDVKFPYQMASITQEQCKSLCASDSKCAAYSYAHGIWSACHLYKGNLLNSVESETGVIGIKR